MRPSQYVRRRWPLLAQLVPARTVAFSLVGIAVGAALADLTDGLATPRAWIWVDKHDVTVPSGVFVSGLIGVLLAAANAFATSARLARRAPSDVASAARRWVGLALVSAALATTPAIGWLGRVAGHAAMTPEAEMLAAACEVHRGELQASRGGPHTIRYGRLDDGDRQPVRFVMRAGTCDGVPESDPAIWTDPPVGADVLNLRRARSGQLFLHIHAVQLAGLVERSMFPGPVPVAWFLAWMGALLGIVAMSAEPVSEAVSRRWGWGSLVPHAGVAIIGAFLAHDLLGAAARDVFWTARRGGFTPLWLRETSEVVPWIPLVVSLLLLARAFRDGPVGRAGQSVRFVWPATVAFVAAAPMHAVFRYVRLVWPSRLRLVLDDVLTAALSDARPVAAAVVVAVLAAAPLGVATTRLRSRPR